MNWIPVTSRNDHQHDLLYICGPKLWEGAPGYSQAVWMGMTWYDPSGHWLTVEGTELAADEVTHFFYPKMPEQFKAITWGII